MTPFALLMIEIALGCTVLKLTCILSVRCNMVTIVDTILDFFRTVNCDRLLQCLDLVRPRGVLVKAHL